MAFTNKPFVWKNNGVTPPETLQNSGFIGGKKLPAPYVNAQWTATYKAIEELQQKAGEVKTVNNVQPDINGNVSIPLPDVSKFYQKPTSGIPKTDLDATVQASLKKADDAAPLTELTKTNQALTTHQADLVSHGIYGVATGTNALVMTDSKVASYVDGMLVAFKNTTSSTGATTLNINSLGAKAIVKANGNPVTNLKANGIYTLRYANGNFILQGEGGEYGTATSGDVLAGKTIGTEDGIISGNIPSYNASTVVVSSPINNVVIPKGYHNGSTVSKTGLVAGDGLRVSVSDSSTYYPTTETIAKSVRINGNSGSVRARFSLSLNSFNSTSYIKVTVDNTEVFKDVGKSSSNYSIDINVKQNSIINFIVYNTYGYCTVTNISFSVETLVFGASTVI